MGVLTYDLLAKDICYVCVIFTVFDCVGRGLEWRVEMFFSHTLKWDFVFLLGLEESIGAMKPTWSNQLI